MSLPEAQWTVDYLSVPENLTLACQTNAALALQLLSEKAQENTQTYIEQQRAEYETQAVRLQQETNKNIKDLLFQLVNQQNNPNPRLLQSKSVKIPDPALYDGDATKLNNFVASLSNKIQHSIEYFLDETAKVSYAYSRLDNACQNRVRGHFRHLYEAGADVTITTFVQFTDILCYYFDDPARKQKADQKLFTLKQRGRSFYDFITEFEDTLADSSWVNQSQQLRPYLEQAVSSELQDVFLLIDAPTDYKGFVDFCRTKDSKIQQKRALRSTRQEYEQSRRPLLSTSSSTQTPAPRGPFPKPFTTLPPSKIFTPLAAADQVLVSRGGNVLDLDHTSQQKGPDGKLTQAAKDARYQLNRCLRCNKEGHIARNCDLPSRPRAFRASENDAGPKTLISSPPSYDQQLKD